MEIKFQHVCNPCEYLLFDNVGSEEELKKCFSEAEIISLAFKGPKETGSAKTNNGEFKKQNYGVFLKEIYTPNFAFYSPISVLLHRVIEISKNGNFTALSQMQHLKNVSGYDILLSAYKNEDYYFSHKDGAVLTALFWFGESDNQGGDLEFTDFNHTIQFASNRAIIFPSFYKHEVTKVKTKKEGYVRYSATGFLIIDGMAPPIQPTTVGTNDF